MSLKIECDGCGALQFGCVPEEGPVYVHSTMRRVAMHVTLEQGKPAQRWHYDLCSSCFDRFSKSMPDRWARADLPAVWAAARTRVPLPVQQQRELPYRFGC